jgi:hypothetical protein
LRLRTVAALTPEEIAMRTQHLLLLVSFALSGPAFAAEPKPAAGANTKPGVESGSRADVDASPAAGSNVAQNATSRKNRVRYTIPPSSKRM